MTEASDADAESFQASLGCLTAPAKARLAAQLSRLPNLGAGEADAVLAGWSVALDRSLLRKLTRLLLVELNAARVEGRLQGDSPEARWRHFLDLTARPAFWSDLGRHYPALSRRIARVMDNHAGAALDFARRWTADRDRLAPLCGGDPGTLTELRFGAGDTHGGGHTVAIAHCARGRIVYKPRSVAIDVALAGFIDWLRQDVGRTLPIHVPRVTPGDGYGWAEFVPHVHAADAAELARFYVGIGQWLALMRLLGGSDLHAENLIAHGARPSVIDCETLFTPRIDPFPSGYGDATDIAIQFVRGTVLAIGLLPSRGQGLVWRGVDASGIGALPGQQPMMTIPTIIGAGTDEARLGERQVEAPAAQNHPAPRPVLADHWPDVLAGFDEMSALLRRLDGRGVLRSALGRFESCRVRAVLRNTEVYAQILRMLWHPVSLNDETKARETAHDLLARMAGNVSTAPGDPAVIAAEIEDMLAGDVPYFSAIADEGRFDGPGGTTWGESANLVDAAWQDWRGADLTLERNYVRSALVCAYVSDGWSSAGERRWPDVVRSSDLDARRRAQAAAIAGRFVETAIRGHDGTVTWIAPMLTPAGWSVQPLDPDLYGGISGVALLAAAYCRETDAGRADPVAGIAPLRDALLRTLDLAEAKQAELTGRGPEMRPPAPGAYMGLAGQVWVRLVLDCLGVDGQVSRAAAMARRIPQTLTNDDAPDVLSGPAGAIPPLLLLAERTGDADFVAIAAELGDRLCRQADLRGATVRWTHRDWPEGLGGFAHGVSGVGWALARLAHVTGDERHRRTAAAALAFEDSLFDQEEQNWIDLRGLGPRSAAAWCHGAVGIGLARLDLDPDLADPGTRLALRRAAAATLRMGLGWNHCACHGDVGAWELLDHAIRLGEGPPGMSRAGLEAAIVTGLEDHGPSCGMLRDAFVPGLLGGLGGIAYQLLRFHAECDLPSFLVPGDGLARVGSRFERSVVSAAMHA
ncbi:type 2 lanthipeptide synthetase LanM family protein [Sphingosinicella sp. LHD-64]|uniref:type 2 lanthipeptide synthetase LanM family protein n=1 Tax=Sphingosinicella sp. LHD-64 TaxID=3072139 RepID=UPI00280F7E5B|nr:type 2 lanthipeptide synthetase LanM family protein [Sphingosinicella sp. LHD-64]MDQ8756592.1 type 2 lanthipeptide synthetase LanM family protein [Sphingosinicella sp. LHD-64]